MSKTINERIEELRIEALAHGDRDTADICQLALDGDIEARETCKAQMRATRSAAKVKAPRMPVMRREVGGDHPWKEDEE